MFLFWIAILAIVVYAIVHAVRHNRTGVLRNCSEDSSIEIAAKRYARGEISRNEYIDIVEGLKKS